jgi:hypothetical protein
VPAHLRVTTRVRLYTNLVWRLIMEFEEVVGVGKKELRVWKTVSRKTILKHNEFKILAWSAVVAMALNYMHLDGNSRS